MPTPTEIAAQNAADTAVAIKNIATNDTQRFEKLDLPLIAERQKSEGRDVEKTKFIGTMAAATKAQADAHKEVATAQQGIASSMGGMEAHIQEMVAKIDPMKADQRDAAVLMGACLDICSPTLTAASRPETIKKYADNAALMFDIAWAHVQVRLRSNAVG